jgi:hypothetical protein
MAMKGSSNYRMSANTPPMDSDQPAPTSSAAPQPIDQNPEAIECVDKLKQMGYTADDVEQAMGGGDDQQQGGDGGAMATGAAKMQIPSMG